MLRSMRFLHFIEVVIRQGGHVGAEHVGKKYDLEFKMALVLLCVPVILVATVDIVIVLLC